MQKKEIAVAGLSTVDEYLAGLPADRGAALEGLRQTIRAAAPDATETIAYLMPAFRTEGQFLVSYAAFKSTSACSQRAMQSSQPAARN